VAASAAAPPPVAAAAAAPAKPIEAAKPPKLAAAAKPAAAKPAAAKSVAKTSPPAKADPIGTMLADADASPAKPGPAKPDLAKTGPASVQIGAFSSKDLADAGWNDAAGLAPGDMAGKNKRVTAVSKADGSTLYRAAITGFSSREEAQALCAKLKAAGQSCFVR
ncbi:MAG: SPOR domain-containing protein, partial [Caulobacteraceae bacterium]